jgi:hypothetical protein
MRDALLASLTVVFLVDGPLPNGLAIGLYIILITGISLSIRPLAEVAAVADGASSGKAARDAGRPTST